MQGLGVLSAGKGHECAWAFLLLPVATGRSGEPATEPEPVEGLGVRMETSSMAQMSGKRLRGAGSGAPSTDTGSTTSPGPSCCSLMDSS